MKAAAVAAFVSLLILSLIFPGAAGAQTAPIRIDISALLRDLGNYKLADAVRASLSQPPFQLASSAAVLTLAAPDGLNGKHDQFVFTVVFQRDGGKSGEAVESCPKNKLSDCTDQLVLDTKTAAMRAN